jgi:hypothetical protein
MYKNIEKLLEESTHGEIVEKVFNYLEFIGEDENKDVLDLVFFDSNNIPVEITVEMLSDTLDDIEDFEAYIGTTEI